MTTLIAILLSIQPAEPEAVKAARGKLIQAPDDAKANQTVGLYLLAQRDPAAVEHLKKASDSTLKRAATLEAEDPLKAAKAWYNVKSYPAKERAALCLEKAWTDAADRATLRPKLAEFAAPPADYLKHAKGASQPAGWWTLTDQFGVSVDSRFAWTGSKSLKLTPPKESDTGWSSGETLNMPIVGVKRVVASAWVFAYDTDFGGQFDIHFRDGAGKRISTFSVPVMQDLPLWKRYEVSADVPANAAIVSLRIDVKITKGAVWCDEVNLTDGTRDLFMGGGFER